MINLFGWPGPNWTDNHPINNLVLINIASQTKPEMAEVSKWIEMSLLHRISVLETIYPEIKN
jgi:hypothetical protein